MRRFLQRLIKFTAYLAAGVVILMAIAVGLFRLMLPRLPEYQEEIKNWASAAIGMQVEFSGMDARWGLRGPELEFYDAELIRPNTHTGALAAREVGVGVSLVRLLVDRALIVDSVTVRESSVELRQLEDGTWRLQGTPIDELFQLHTVGDRGIGEITVIGQDLELLLIQPQDPRPQYFSIPRAVVQRDALRVAADVDINLPEGLGGDLSVAATRLTAADASVEPWNVSIDADEIDLAAVSALLDDDLRRFNSGAGDLDLSLAIKNGSVLNATAVVEFSNVELRAGGLFDVSGRVDVKNDDRGWLVEIDELNLSTARGDWPRSTLRLETGADEHGETVMLDVRASYLNLADLELLSPWIPAEHQATFDRYRPDGVIEALEATVSDIGTDTPRYAVTAELRGAGIAATDTLPGVRGFSGHLRADHDGGLLEIASEAMTITIPAIVSDAVEVDEAIGTVIWRRSDSRTTVLSDNIAIRNTFFDSSSNVEVIIEGENAPVVDLASSWAINDIVQAKRYIPEAVMKPRLFLWFQDALISGRIPRGTARLYGPLDKFPFDNDEGRLHIEANVRDLEFRYARLFPSSHVSDMDVVLDNLHLYTERNRADSLGILTSDAYVEIPDLRRPILEIDSFSSGSLQSMHEYVVNSPLARVFGGQVDRFEVGGDATVDMKLTVPILDWRSYTLDALLRTNNGSVLIDGLRAPITEISGAVRISKNDVASESLGGQFLGEPLRIDFQNAPPELPQFRTVAHVAGTATARGLVEDLGVPLEGKLTGRTGFEAEVLFPRPAQEQPQALTVKVRSSLNGLAVELPTPFAKLASDSRNFDGEMQILPGEDRVRSSGRIDQELGWRLDFMRTDERWDFDRGTLVLGDGPVEDPDTRGLHIRGQTGEVRFEDWLALSRNSGGGLSIADRIRSIDINVEDLYLLGQHLKNHTASVDRSARDWLVQFDGESVRGSVFVPYDFGADRAIVLDMERLILPGDETAVDDAPAILDPRKLPPISLKATEFAFGERFLGALKADAVRTPDGLAASAIVATDESFEIVGNGSWVYDETDALSSRSYITATLTSTNVDATMRRLNYQPGIVSDDMGVLIDVSWSGGPRMEFLETLDGEVQVRLGSGQLIEVEPGAGRMFGLMSIVALPRRLSLDFRDVFQKGFGFDNISGTFRLDDGEAYTCDLSLQGPAADIGILGRVDLADRNYSQTAVVSANVGSTLPVAAGLAAGPQAAAALFLFSQIFKKPLKDIGKVYYSVSGPWDEPVIESTNADALATSGELAGCLEETGSGL